MMTRTLLWLGWVVAGITAATGQDRFAGDWEGSVTWRDGTTEPLAARLIPDGGERYRMRVFPNFTERAPAAHALRGWIREGQFAFIDDVPLEKQHVVRATEDGLVVGASLWSGPLGDGVEGKVEGVRNGTFTLRQVPWKDSPTLGKPAPAGALVLFDGKNLDHWVKRGNPSEVAGWKLVEEGAMEVSGGDIMTRETFGDHELHLEFRLALMPEARGQARSNSGVYPQGRFEVQVLDSYGLDGADNECGGIYTLARPLLNMCAPPLRWQTYDMVFRAARFDAAGQRTANPRITVVHNGVTIHDDLELKKLTGGALDPDESRPGPLLLQDHGNPVRYRNIWVRPLD